MSLRGDLPLRVRRVKIVGNKRTRPHVVEDEFQAAYTGTTLEEVYGGLLVGAAKLDSMGLFDSVSVVMDEVPESAKETDVIITVKEKNWYAVKVGTTTSGEAGSLLRHSGSGKLRNVAGYGETFNLGYNSAISALASRSFYSSLFLPRILGADSSLSVEGVIDSVDRTRYSSLTELRRAVTAIASTFDLAHALKLELGLRDIVPKRHPSVPYASAASLAVVADARPSVKGSITYTYTDDQRNHPFLPTKGSYFQASGEGAGLMGDTVFAKGTFEAQSHIPVALLKFGSLVSPMSVSLCASGGFIRPLGSSKRTCFSDRFDVGGPLSVRGFQPFGLGPRAPKEEGGCAQGDSLGGDIKYTASAALSFPLPSSPMAHAGWRGHLFTNVGNLTSWDTPLTQYARDTRASVGIGAVWSFMDAGRVEINYSHAFRKSPVDDTKGLQFGFGFTFL